MRRPIVNWLILFVIVRLGAWEEWWRVESNTARRLTTETEFRVLRPDRSVRSGMDDFLTKPVRPTDLQAAIDRVLAADSRRQSPSLDLLDAPVLLAACGGDPTLLGKMCQSLYVRVPEHLAALRDALRDQDALRLREAAHKFCGMLSEFSTAAGDLAGNLEGLAAGAQPYEAPPILDKLETIAGELLQLVDGPSIETLRHEAEKLVDRERH